MKDFIHGLQGELKRLQVSQSFHFYLSNVHGVGFVKRIESISNPRWC